MKETIRTIEDLLNAADKYQMPLEKMRFFINQDCKEPSCFGLYQAEDGDFVVYKNKSNGQRAVRYKGPNEKKAVNEIWDKITEEVKLRQKRDDWMEHVQNMNNDEVYREEYLDKVNKKQRRRRASSTIGNIFTKMVKYGLVLYYLFIIAALVFSIFRFARSSYLKHSSRPSEGYGYYTYDDDLYYYHYPYWYTYDNDSWTYYDYTPGMDLDDFIYQGTEYNSSFDQYGSGDEFVTFDDYYETISQDSDNDGSYDYWSNDDDWSNDWDDSWDYDYDYDYDSWDSYDTDWDSDW